VEQACIRDRGASGHQMPLALSPSELCKLMNVKSMGQYHDDNHA